MIGLPYLSDSLVNLTSNLGNPEKDKAVGGRFGLRNRVTRQEIDAIYSQTWLGGKIVDIPAQDATREWRQWNGTKSNIEALEDAEDRLSIREKVLSVVRWAAKDGGAALVMGAPGNPGDPLDPQTVQKGDLRWVHPMSRWELSFNQLDRDPESPWFGEPLHYLLPSPDGTNIPIHPSRVVRFVGVPRSDMFSALDPWGDSVYERMHDAIRDALAAAQTAASMLQEAKVDVIKIPGLSENVVRADYRAQVVQRFGLAMALKSLNNTLLLDAAEVWEQKQLHWQGLPEIIRSLLEIAAGAADIPVTRLYGRSPSGMNATGEADLEAYYTMVRSRQQTHLRSSLKRLDAVLVRHATGRQPRGLFYDWRTLWSPAVTDLAEVNFKHANAIESISRSGLFSPGVLQKAAVAQFEEDSFLAGIGEAVKADPVAPGNVQVQTTTIAAEAKAKEAASRPAPAPAPAVPRRPRRAAAPAAPT